MRIFRIESSRGDAESWRRCRRDKRVIATGARNAFFYTFYTAKALRVSAPPREANSPVNSVNPV